VHVLCRRGKSSLGQVLLVVAAGWCGLELILTISLTGCATGTGRAQKLRLVGDCLLTSFLSYTGNFTFDYRHEMVLQMGGRRAEKRLRIRSLPPGTLLTDEVGGHWLGIEGLPSSELSVQNGILTMRASRCDHYQYTCFLAPLWPCCSEWCVCMYGFQISVKHPPGHCGTPARNHHYSQ
jgi:hypothetical protein